MTLLRKRPTRRPATLRLTANPSLSNQVGVFYSQANLASGGTAPYIYSVVSVGGLPPGLALQTTGIVSGIPLTAGSYSYTIQVTDSTSGVATATSTPIISGSALQITAGPVSGAQVGAAYSQANSALNGVPPYTFAITAGAPPLGVGSINTSTGLVSGTPLVGAIGSFSYTVRVNDNLGAQAFATVSGTVIAAAVGGVVLAASPDLADVLIAIGNAKTGDKVMVPAGVAVWPSTAGAVDGTSLTVSKNVSLIGAGDFIGGTTIYSDFSNHALLQFSAPSTGFVEFTGFRFQYIPSGPGEYLPVDRGVLRFNGPTNWKNLRVHHNTLSNIANYGMDAQTGMCALFDHNIFDGYASGIHMSGQGISEQLDTNRSGPSGDRSGWLFMEDNNFLFNAIGGRPVDDLEYGGRVVCRYNYGTTTFFQTHDMARTGAGYPGGAHYEVYGNQFVGIDGIWTWKGIDIASGTGVLYNNKFTGPWIHPISFLDSRSDPGRGLAAGVQRCDGTSSWDGNTAGGQGYICYQQAGSLGAQGAPASFPIYVWGNTLNGSALSPVFGDITSEGDGTLTHLHLQIGRDIKNVTNGADPAATPPYTYPGQYTYPHPLQASGTSWGKTYWIDFAVGNNTTNDGLTPGRPWKTCPGMSVSGVTNPTTTVNPGDRIYFNCTQSWTTTGAKLGMNLLGGVTYIGDQWPPEQGTKAKILAASTMSGGVVWFRDHATIPTRFIGFEVDAANQPASGISVNFNDGAATGPLTGAMKTIRNCVVKNVGGQAVNGFYKYGIIVSNHHGTTDEVANVEIIDCTVSAIARDGILAYPGDEDQFCLISNITIRGCTVSNVSTDPLYTSGSCIVVKGHVVGATVEGNYVSGPVEGSGIFLNGQEQRHNGAMTSIHVRRNIVNVTALSGQAAVRIYDDDGVGDPKDIHFYGNIVMNSGAGDGLKVTSGALTGPSGTGGATNTMRFYNNTFLNAPVNIAVGSAPFSTLEFTNNVVVKTSSGIPLVSDRAFTAHSNNVLRGAGTLVSQGGSFTSTNLTTWEPTALWSNGSATTSGGGTADPLFSNIASLPTGFSGLFELASNRSSSAPSVLVMQKPNASGLALVTTSPAKNHGVALGAPYNISIDKGAPRPLGAAYDCGAYEVV